MTGTREIGVRRFAKTTMTFLTALLVIFGTGVAFVTVTKAAQNSRGIESGSAALAEAKAVEVKEPVISALPEDIPVFKGGNIRAGRIVNGLAEFEILFSLGAKDDVMAFYHAEMPKAGWEKNATGNSFAAYRKSSGARKASLTFSYCGGKVLLCVRVS